MEVEHDDKPMFKRSVETQACLDIIMASKPGDVIPYSAFTKAVGLSLQKCRHNIIGARRIAQHEHEIVTEAVWSIGIKRLDNVEIPQTGVKDLARMRNTARRSARRMTCVEYNELPEQGKVLHNTHLTVCAIVQKATKPRAVKELETEVARIHKVLPIGTALKRLGVQVNGEKEEDKE